MENSSMDCTALCKSFICEKQPPALKVRKRSNKKEVWCTWIDEECDQGWCLHSKCAERKMSQDAKCKKAASSVQTKEEVKLDAPYPDAMPKEIARKFREKR
ncbi:MAG: hypothetical protein ACW98U_13705 [Candidatus Thorarchaeota archaeon]